MNSHISLLQIHLNLTEYRFAFLSLITAFVVTLVSIPPIIALIRKYKLYDQPNARKEHAAPVPTMGGIAVLTGLIISLLLWFPFTADIKQICFFFSILMLAALGVMDDLKDLSARFKFLVQVSLALLVAVSGIRITSFQGFLGINELQPMAQYSITVVLIVGVTNAFNLIDGIDGLAGGIGFMSLSMLGIMLTINRDANTALIAFALAGALLAFLYFNFNPAKIFMGDTGSLVLGFVIAVLSIRLVRVNTALPYAILPQGIVMALGVVLIPVFDTCRVFTIRIWNGKSPFSADKTHIHHLLTRQGFSHAFAAKLICTLHGFILLEIYWMRSLRPEIIFSILTGFMLVMIVVLKHFSLLAGKTGVADNRLPAE